jgi:hypothetical protein
VLGEDAAVKLACVATDVLGVKLPALTAALNGKLLHHHALIVSHILAHLDYLDEIFQALTIKIEQRLALSSTRSSCSRQSTASLSEPRRPRLHHQTPRRATRKARPSSHLQAAA